MKTSLFTKGIKVFENLGKRYFVLSALLLGLIKMNVIRRTRYAISSLLIVVLLTLVYVALSSRPVKTRIKEYCKKEYLIAINALLLATVLLNLGEYLYFYRIIISLISIVVLFTWLSAGRGIDSKMNLMLDIVQIAISVMVLIGLCSWLCGLLVFITALITLRRSKDYKGVFIRACGVILLLIFGMTSYRIFLYDPLEIFYGSLSDTLTNLLVSWMSITKLYSVASFSGDSILTMGYKYLEMNLVDNVPAYILCYNGKVLFIIYTVIECITVLMGIGYYRWSYDKNNDGIRDAIALLAVSAYIVCAVKSTIMFSTTPCWYMSLLTVLLVLDRRLFVACLDEVENRSRLKKLIEIIVPIVVFAVLGVRIYMTIPYYNSMNHATRSDSQEIIAVKTIKDRKMNLVQTAAPGVASKTYEHIYEEDLKSSRIIRFSENGSSGYYDCLTGNEIMGAEINGSLARFNGLMAMEKNTSPGAWTFQNLEGEDVYEDQFKNVEALDHCSYLCECNDGGYIILDLQGLYRNDNGQANICKIPEKYMPEIVKGEILVFRADQDDKSLVYINERNVEEGNSDSSHWIRHNNCWKSTEVGDVIRDIIIAGRSFSANVPESVVFSYKEKDGTTYEVEGFGENFHKDDLDRYKYMMDDTGVFTEEQELQNEYSVPVKPDEEGIRWIYGLQIF